MVNGNPRFYAILFSLGFVIILTFFVLQPFLYSLILALIFALVFQPFYKRILKATRGQELFSTFLTILILVIFIIIPLIIIFFQIFREADGLYLSLVNSFGNQSGNGIWLNLNQKLSSVVPFLGNLSADLDQYLKSVLTFLIKNLGSIFSNIVRIFVNLFVFLVAFFFLLKDGAKLKQKIVDLSPLNKEDDELIIKKVTIAINSVIKGSLLVAVLQGIACSIGFAIFGVPNPILWGSLAVIGALIPGVGTALVLAPAIIYLYFTGAVVSSIGLLIWGIFAVGLIDNFLGPRFVGKGIGLHPLLVLVSVFGGLSFFGPLGFILGPLTVSLLIVLLDIYASVVKKV